MNADDPVKAGLVASLSRPGGNITGVNFLAAELGANGWSSCASWCPQARSSAVLVNPTNPITESH